jgi:arsenite-transporting ATPase
MALNGLSDGNLKLLLFGGKGGVGKTSCAVATALALSEHYKTLLISTDPAHSIADSLELPVGYNLTRLQSFPNLTAIEVVADQALHGFKTAHWDELKKLLETSTNLDKDDIENMLAISLPGIDEVMSFKTIMDFVGAGDYEKYIVDTAPTGHALRLISSPKLLDEWIKMAARMRWKYRYMVTSFSGSYKQDDVDTFLLELKKTVRGMERMLRDIQMCQFIPVCVPEAMAIHETRRLLSHLENAGIVPKQMVVNNIMNSDGCVFCRKRGAAQLPYLAEIRSNFSALNLVEIPLFETEIMGLDTLTKLGKYLINTN